MLRDLMLEEKCLDTGRWIAGLFDLYDWRDEGLFSKCEMKKSQGRAGATRTSDVERER